MTEEAKLAIVMAHIKVARDKGESINKAIDSAMDYIEGEEEREKNEI